jgi:lipopolysaccharide assembly outer membrane protein LptD (OstA)
VKRTPLVVITAIVFWMCAPCVSRAQEAQEETLSADKSEDKQAGFSEEVTVNGDEVEYDNEAGLVIATGNVEIVYKGAKLNADRVTVNMKEKIAVAQGHARLEDDRGVVEGERIEYAFEKRVGTLTATGFRSPPYYGTAEKVEKVGDAEIVAHRASFSTCDYDHPHFHLGAKRVNIFPGEKMQARSVKLYMGNIPIVILPRLSRSLKDPFMHVRFIPGKDGEWGPFLLSAWRYNLTPNVDGRIYVDYRDRLGLAKGFGTNYRHTPFGSGDLLFYHTDEEPREITIPDDKPDPYERFLTRWRHKWEIDERTSFVSEVVDISDERRKALEPSRSFLKDYFPREYEEDSEPLSYGLLHRNFDYSSLDVLAQKRTNQWFDQVERLPEVTYSMPDLKLGDTPFYFEHESQFAVLDKKAVTSPGSDIDHDVTRLDTANQLSLPSKVACIQVTPFVQMRETLYDKLEDGETDFPVRSIFSTGVDLSTKFYRIFDVTTDAFGLDINRLRHVITPTVAYSYVHEPTIIADRIKQIDPVDAITRGNSAALLLSNKLQTKRDARNVDLADFRVGSTYVFDPKTGNKLGSNFSDVLFELDLIPYSWAAFYSDVTYARSGNRSDDNYRKFTIINYDFAFSFGPDRALNIGQRYARKAGNAITTNIAWRLNPKWKFKAYQRYEIGHDPTLTRGLKEQEYGVERDLHCWVMDVTYNIDRTEGESVWFVFKLKAFPEVGFNFDQQYHQPKTGSQGAS